MIDAPPKHVDSDKWYSLTWSSAELKNASITLMTWGDSVPAGITKSDQSLSGLTCAVRVSGGVLDTFYEIPLQIQTDAGETLNSGLRFKIHNQGH